MIFSIPDKVNRFMPEKLLVTVDAIDDGLASLLLQREDDETPLGVFPVTYLPKGTVAGDILSLSFTKEEKETMEAKRKITDVLTQLKNRK